jgi:hypothetical protein
MARDKQVINQFLPADSTAPKPSLSGKSPARRFNQRYDFWRDRRET